MASSHTRRSRGEGSVYRIADGRWKAALLVTDPRTGATVRRYVSGRSRAETVRKLDTTEGRSRCGCPPDRSHDCRVPGRLAGWLESERPRIRASTWRERAQHIRLYLSPAIGSIQAAKLTPTDAERMTSGMVAAGKSPRTAAHTRVTLRRALGDALRDGLVSRNVAALARPPRVPNRAMEAGRTISTPPT
jgi:integrase